MKTIPVSSAWLHHAHEDGALEGCPSCEELCELADTGRQIVRIPVERIDLILDMMHALTFTTCHTARLATYAPRLSARLQAVLITHMH